MRKLHTLTDQAIANYASSARSYAIGQALKALASPDDLAPPFLRATSYSEDPSHASYVSDGMGAWVSYWSMASHCEEVAIAIARLYRASPIICKVLCMLHMEERSIEAVAVALGRSERRVYQLKEEGEKRLIEDLSPRSLYALVKETSILALVYSSCDTAKDAPPDSDIAA